MYRAIILDFDGTLTRSDVLDHVAQGVGKLKESSILREDFQSGRSKGLEALVQRINLLQGARVSYITSLLTDSLLTPGHDTLRRFLADQRLVTVIVSGNICPVVTRYRSHFNADAVFCTELIVHDGVIQGVEPTKIGKRPGDVWRYLESHQIRPVDAIAVGDDPSDEVFFGAAGWSVAFNAQRRLAAQQTVDGDLTHLTAALRTVCGG